MMGIIPGSTVFVKWFHKQPKACKCFGCNKRATNIWYELWHCGFKPTIHTKERYVIPFHRCLLYGGDDGLNAIRDIVHCLPEWFLSSTTDQRYCWIELDDSRPSLLGCQLLWHHQRFLISWLICQTLKVLNKNNHFIERSPIFTTNNNNNLSFVRYAKDDYNNDFNNWTVNGSTHCISYPLLQTMVCLNIVNQ